MTWWEIFISGIFWIVLASILVGGIAFFSTLITESAKIRREHIRTKHDAQRIWAEAHDQGILDERLAAMEPMGYYVPAARQNPYGTPAKN